MSRGLDHVVHAVRDLDAAAHLYRRLGFRVGARNRHPWGTHNHIIQLPGFFIEVLTVAEPDRLGADAFSRLFGRFNQDFLAHADGLSLLILESHDAPTDAACFARAGIAASDVLAFEREGRRADGAVVTVGFSLVFARDPLSPGTAFAVCRQHHPQNFWSRDLQEHPNTACAVLGVVLTAENPADHHIFLSAFVGERALQASSLGLTLRTPRGEVQVLTPQGFRDQFGRAVSEPGGGLRLRALRIGVREPAAAHQALRSGGLDPIAQGNRLIVPAAAAMGAVLAFEPVAAA